MRHLLCVLAALALSGCVSPYQGRPLSYGEFPAAEYQALPVSGDGRIAGRAFLKTRSGATRTAAGQDVALIPATRYMEPMYQAYQQQRPIGSPDPRAKIYTRLARADAEGRFSFDRVPAGRYYLTCDVSWEVPGTNGPTRAGAFIVAPLSLRQGEVVEVELTR
ncbi:hypothetical protein [Pseudomonas citronellolis]|uniref:hypothetical protein n=1 Tax=Pseudomonas citronellolis TaxID=53408 RepID=UPI0023E3B6BA|nr:hypothetical protein [Pseudomonas citronellolis]MDF3936642.1 hypothetical protein [Pseudomonas citronellolis]